MCSLTDVSSCRPFVCAQSCLLRYFLEKKCEAQTNHMPAGMTA